MFSPSSFSSELYRDNTGIWFSRKSERVAYPDDGNAGCFQVEEHSFWFRHRNTVILSLVGRFPPRGMFFDVGGGNGFVSAALQDAGFEVALIEPGLDGIRNARSRGVRNLVCSAFDSVGFFPASTPAIGLFDVLEHVKDDGGFLQKIFAALSPGGRVYIAVPSWWFLWSAEDTFAGHYRRYSLSSLSRRLCRCGFRILYKSFFFALLPLPILVLRTMPTALGLREAHAGSAINELAGGGSRETPFLDRYLRLEAGIIAGGGRIPFGASCFVIAEKPVETGGFAEPIWEDRQLASKTPDHVPDSYSSS